MSDDFTAGDIPDFCTRCGDISAPGEALCKRCTPRTASRAESLARALGTTVDGLLAMNTDDLRTGVARAQARLDEANAQLQWAEAAAAVAEDPQ